MNKKRIRKLIKALRSGKYKQGFFKLRDQNDCYCVAGVACDISNLYRWRPYYSKYFYGDSFSTMCPEVCEYYGIKNSLNMTFNGLKMSIFAANDSLKLSFEQIANCLETEIS